MLPFLCEKTSDAEAIVPGELRLAFSMSSEKG
jgi:hypothetical protein